MNRSAGGRGRESLKLGIRTALMRANLNIAKDPYPRQLRRALDHAGVINILDVGANVGQFAALVRRAGFEGRIVSVEPLDDAFESLSRRARTDRNWEVRQTAVGAKPGRAKIHVAGNSYSSSLLEVNSTHVVADPTSRTTGVQDTEVTTVDALMSELNLKPEFTLLKVDTQGFESQVLDGSSESIGSLAAVQVELSFVELYEGQALAPEIASRLSQDGLRWWAIEAGMSDDRGRTLQADGLFVRRDP